MEEFKKLWQEWIHLGPDSEQESHSQNDENLIHRIQHVESKRKRYFRVGLFNIIGTLLLYLVILIPFGITVFQVLGLLSIGTGAFILLRTYQEGTLQLSQDAYGLNIRDFCLQVRERYTLRARHVVTTPLLYGFFLFVGVHLVIHPFIVLTGQAYGGIIGAYYGFSLAILGYTLHQLVKKYRENEQEILGQIQAFLRDGPE